MPNLTTTQSAGGRLLDLAHLHTVAKQERSLRFNNLLHLITPYAVREGIQPPKSKISKGHR
jgi:hypothetical protein